MSVCVNTTVSINYPKTIGGGPLSIGHFFFLLEMTQSGGNFPSEEH